MGVKVIKKRKSEKKGEKLLDKEEGRVLYEIQFFEKYFVQMFGEPNKINFKEVKREKLA